jgi:hypothetical protein
MFLLSGKLYLKYQCPKKAEDKREKSKPKKASTEVITRSLDALEMVQQSSNKTVESEPSV